MGAVAVTSRDFRLWDVASGFGAAMQRARVKTKFDGQIMV